MSRRYLILLFNSILVVGGQDNNVLEPPTIYWSMDTIQGSRLLPDIGDTTNWSGDLTPATNFEVAGYHNNGLRLDEEINVADNLNNRENECLFNPSLCSEGLTVAMWLNMEGFGTNLVRTIFRSGGITVRTPGIAIYPDAINTDSLTAAVMLPNGQVYEASINRDLVGVNRWAHVTTTWSRTNGIKVFVNGTEAVYTHGPSVGTNTVSTSTTPPLRFGLDSVVIIMDDIKVWYRELTTSEVALAPTAGVQTQTTTPATVPPTNPATQPPTNPATTTACTPTSTQTQTCSTQCPDATTQEIGGGGLTTCCILAIVLGILAAILLAICIVLCVKMCRGKRSESGNITITEHANTAI